MVLVIMLSMKWSSAADQHKTFFSDLDTKIESHRQGVPERRTLIVERYLRLLARLDIYGMYCDHRNRVGYSTRVAVLQRGSIRLEKWTRELFGRVGAYNRFERYRTQESLRYVKSDRMSTCRSSEAQFLSLTSMDPKNFRIYLSDPPFGSL